MPFEMPTVTGTLRTAGLLFCVLDFYGGVAILVVEDGLLGDGEGVLVLVENDFGVGRHVGLELAAGIVDGDADLEGGDVVFLNAERGDLGDLAEEGLVAEALDLDAGGLAEVDLADVGLVDLALDVDLGSVAEGEDLGGGGAENEDGGDGVAHFDVAGEDGAVDGRGDVGVGELFLELLEGGVGLGGLGVGLVELGLVHGDLGDGFVACVGGEEILLVGVVEGLLGDDAIFLHLFGAGIGVLIHGQVGGLGGDAVELDGGGGGVGVGLGGGELCALGGDLGEDLDLIELGELLAGVDVLVDVNEELGDDAGGLAFDFDLGDGGDFAGGDDGAGDVAALDFGELRGFKLWSGAMGDFRDAESEEKGEGGEATPEPETAFLLWCHSAVPPGRCDGEAAR